MQPSTFRHCALLLLPAALFVSTAGVRAQAPEAPPPAVSVETIEPSPLPMTFEYPGRIAASREVEVRARVSGILLERKFEEGARVEKGQVLFQIDPKPYQAQVAAAEAAVRQAEAQLAQAQRQEKRAQELVRRQATSQATLDNATSSRELAEAQLAAAQANLQTAQLSLEYATVESPLSGITSLEQVPEGSLLANGDLLTKVSQLDPIYVNFSAPDTETAFIRQLLDQSNGNGEQTLSVGLQFGDGSKYGQTGRIDFTSSSIDSDTGTVLSRAVLPNHDERLLPGQFVRVTISGIVIPDAITIPTSALMQSPQGPFVYTIDDQSTAQVAPIQIARELQNRVVINSGLEAGDRVVTEGVIKVRPKAPVNVDRDIAQSEAETTDVASDASGAEKPEAEAEAGAGAGAEEAAR
ncbi:efflux RND transporter periplasmic adaptor subunit [Consotaella aegiceratis]|uniref:efflux RND transporter periplasmic adaptor subunit n=1 Tax=Consotaella aegiceratis TaxID=3097961 RepID=UPI002F427521